MKSNLFEELKNYSHSDFYPFHMPGHKRNPENNRLPEFYQYDITEIDGFDNLHQPEGIIDEAQKKAARIYSSEETYFLVNGSTAGILSAISAIAEQGGKLLIARNCHKSVYHAAFVNHLELDYVYPEMIYEYGLSGKISTEEIQTKLKSIFSEQNVKIAGMVITSPTYDGISSDVRQIAEIVHSYGIPLIVDQAHGAHFGFHPDYPESAVILGADIVIHSVHKTLPAPTQTAIVHKNGSLVDSKKLQRYLHIYQSSSPSYPLMAGIETAISILETEGYDRLEKMSHHYKRIKQAADNLKYLKICPLTEPGKVIISIKDTYITGQQLYDIFREKYHLQMEMAAGSYVTAILSVMDQEEGILRLIEAMEEIDRRLSDIRESDDVKVKKVLHFPEKFSPQKRMELWEAYISPYEELELTMLLENVKQLKNEAEVPYIAAEFVNLYPPGIPIIVPGEILDEDILQIVSEYLKNGYNVQGIENNKIKVVCLPKEGEHYEKN